MRVGPPVCFSVFFNCFDNRVAVSVLVMLSPLGLEMPSSFNICASVACVVYVLVNVELYFYCAWRGSLHCKLSSPACASSIPSSFSKVFLGVVLQEMELQRRKEMGKIARRIPNDQTSFAASAFRLPEISEIESLCTQ